MKIVLDTNVFISGIFFSGPPSIILQAWRDSKIQIILSEEILEKYQYVADELSSKFPAVDIARIIELLTIYGEVFETKGISVSVCEDPDDNKFIECAIASNSKFIVTGYFSAGFLRILPGYLHHPLPFPFRNGVPDLMGAPIAV
ncbi:MAG: putative toxin-antitoxin system toxin component, PIN family, partial [Deltaproteobacteria bacterium]|nr:putative toxin-antitoxin system toxin component, PIN family [Deltaproteobacteria bacterium]